MPDSKQQTKISHNDFREIVNILQEKHRFLQGIYFPEFDEYMIFYRGFIVGKFTREILQSMLQFANYGEIASAIERRIIALKKLIEEQKHFYKVAHGGWNLSGGKKI